MLSLTYRIPSPGKFSVPSRGCNAFIIFALCTFVKRVLSPRGDELFHQNILVFWREIWFPSPRGDELFLYDMDEFDEIVGEFPSPRGDELFLHPAKKKRNLCWVSVPSRG